MNYFFLTAGVVEAGPGRPRPRPPPSSRGWSGRAWEGYVNALTSGGRGAAVGTEGRGWGIGAAAAAVGPEAPRTSPWCCMIADIAEAVDDEPRCCASTTVTRRPSDETCNASRGASRVVVGGGGGAC
jgi:hypothetical protein